MKASDKGLQVIHSSSGQDAEQRPTSRLQIIAAVVGLSVLLGGAAYWSHRDTGQNQSAASQAPTGAQAEASAFEYFPAQYVNQAKEVEEHIEAF